MLQIFVEVLVPVFGVVAVGFALARTTGTTPQNLTSLAYWVLGPVFIFSVLSNADLEAGAVGRIVAATALAMVGVAVVGLAMARFFGISRSLAGASTLTAIYGNAGNFGLAISAFALGDEALPIAGVALVTINTLGILTGVGMANARRDSVWTAARAAVTSPLALALIPALIVNLGDVDLPIWFSRPVDLVAAAMIPVMLLTLGIQLAGMPRRFPRRLVSLPIALKLVLAPTFAFVAISLLGLTGLDSKVVILMSAMPAAVFTSLIALEHDIEPDFVTSVVLIGTLASAITLPIVISLL